MFLLVLSGLLFILFILVACLKNVETPSRSLNILTNGEKYEVVSVYEKYIIIKSATDTDNKKLKFIGPLDFGTMTTGRYIKTTENLEKID